MSRSYAILIVSLVIAAAVAGTYVFKYVSLNRQYRGLWEEVGKAKQQEEALGAAREELTSVEGDLAATRQTVEELRAELGSLEGDLAAGQQTGEELRGELASVEGDLAASRQTVKELRAELASARGKLASVEEDLVASLKTGGELRAKLVSTRAELARKDAALKASEGKLAANQLALEQLSVERDVLKTGLVLFRARVGEALSRLRNVQEAADTRFARLLADKEKLARALREREEEVQGLLAERTQEVTMRELAREEISRALEVLEGLRDNTEIVRNEVIWLGEEISQGLAERDKLVTAAEEADQYLRKWAGDFARMGGQYEQLLTAVRHLEEERDRFAQGMREREDELRELLGSRQQELSERERARREIERTVVAVEELKGSFGAIRNEMLALEARVVKSLAEKRELVGIVQETQVSLQRWAGEFERIGQRYDDVRVLAYRSEQERARLAETLATREEEIAVLETARAQLEESEEEALQRLSEMAADIRRSEQERENLALLVQKLEELAEEKTEELGKLKQAYEELVGRLTRELAQKDIEIVGMKDRLTVRVLDKVLFDLGSTRIKPEGKKVLDRLLPTLKQAQGGLIVVEGHTDNVPIKKKYRWLFPTNWELSTSRATRIVRHLQEKGVEPERLAAVGYSYYRPILSHETQEGRRRNRRIEIVVYPQVPERAPTGM